MRLPSLVLVAVLSGLCLGAGRGSVDGLADVLGERVRATLERPREVDLAIAVAAPSPKLAADLGELLATRLRSGAGAVRSAARFDGTPAAARAAGFDRLVQLQVETTGPKLRVTGTVVSLAGGLWDARPEPQSHLHAEVALDDELRAYLPQGAAQGAWQTRSLPLGDVALLAIDVGDADGDGRPELVGATATELIAWGLEGGRAVERWRIRLDGRPATLRPRADVATVTVDAGAVSAHASGFADGVVRARGVLKPARGYAFPGLAGACELEPGVDWFSAAGCGALAAELPASLWTAAALRRAGPRVVAAIVPGGAGGTLWLRVGGEPPIVQRGVGAQVALAALERGEVVATSEMADAPGEADAVVVRGIGAGLPVLHRVERLGGKVRALAGGDVDGDGRAELLAAVRDDGTRKTELWIIH